MRMIDRTGMRFGRLLVLSKSPEPVMWDCKCDCGATVKIRGCNLSNGSTKSCGCLAMEHAAALGSNEEYFKFRSGKASHLYRHGGCQRSGKTTEFKIWERMRNRCNRTSHHAYDRYGGRGIKVCDEWMHSFENFIRDMGMRPSVKHSLDRIDNNGNYCKENCRWATSKEQNCNKRNNVKVTINGIEYASITIAAAELGIAKHSLQRRLKAGMPPELAFHRGDLTGLRRQKWTGQPK